MAFSIPDANENAQVAVDNVLSAFMQVKEMSDGLVDDEFSSSIITAKRLSEMAEIFNGSKKTLLSFINMKLSRIEVPTRISGDFLTALGYFNSDNGDDINTPIDLNENIVVRNISSLLIPKKGLFRATLVGDSSFRGLTSARMKDPDFDPVIIGGIGYNDPDTGKYRRYFAKEPTKFKDILKMNKRS